MLRRQPEGADPLDARVLAAAMAAAMRTASQFWLEHGAERQLADLIDEALRVLVDGQPAD